MSKAPRESFSIDCRNCGPGGTTIDFYPTSEGLKAIWHNENLPYDLGGTKDPDTYEASDGHNVSLISWSTLEKLLAQRAKGKKF
jgi:hypothetical protein